MNRPPCKVDGHDCENRFPGCHDKCLKYMDYARGREEYLKKRAAYKQDEDYMMRRTAKRHKIWVERSKK